MPVTELKEGFFLTFVGAAVPPEHENKFYRVAAVETLTYDTGDETTTVFSSVASGAESGYISIDPLEPKATPMHLFLVHPGIRDGGRYQMKIPDGSDRMGIDDQLDIARLDNLKSPWVAPGDDFAFYLLHNQVPAVNVENVTPEAFTPKMYFTGEKYQLDLVADLTLVKKLQNYAQGISPYVPCKLVTLGGIKN